MNKKYYLWFLLLVFPLSVFIVFSVLLLMNPDSANWLDLSLTTSTSIATIILGIMVYIQSEKHKISDNEKNAVFQKEEKACRDLDLIIRTSPYITFLGIEYAKASNNISYGISPVSPDCLIYVDNKFPIKDLDTESFIETYNKGVFFRFIFNCQEERGLNNVTFTSVNIYPRYPDDVKQRVERIYNFQNYCKESISNISYLGENKYQVCKYFMFPTNSFGESVLAKQFENDLIFENKQVFFNIRYSATNIYGVAITGELKFFSTVTFENGILLFGRSSNLSNWIDNPQKVY